MIHPMADSAGKQQSQEMVDSSAGVQESQEVQENMVEEGSSVEVGPTESVKENCDEFCLEVFIFHRVETVSL